MRRSPTPGGCADSGSRLRRAVRPRGDPPNSGQLQNGRAGTSAQRGSPQPCVSATRGVITRRRPSAPRGSVGRLGGPDAVRDAWALRRALRRWTVDGGEGWRAPDSRPFSF